jgi:hypothetical protein
METEREKRNNVREKIKVNVTNFHGYKRQEDLELTISCARNTVFFFFSA